MCDNYFKSSYMLVKLIPQVIGGCDTSVSIINCEKGDVWPDLVIGEISWFLHVNNNSNPIFIFGSDQSNVCIRCITLNNWIWLSALLWRLQIELMLLRLIFCDIHNTQVNILGFWRVVHVILMKLLLYFLQLISFPF